MAKPLPEVVIVGGGLAGCEAAWQLAERGVSVRLYEMRPEKKTPAHQTANLGELVCSNSFRGADLHNAVGLLKEEMRVLDSLIMTCADAHRIPGGGALVIDREGFSRAVTGSMEDHSNIQILRKEITHLEEIEGCGAIPIVIATGPLTSEALSKEIARLTGSEYLYFYDSIAPIVEADSIDFDKVFRASRYGKGSEDYLNCPLNCDQYLKFVQDLVASEKVPTKDFEQAKFFEGCLPIEVMAERGKMALAFGPMKPVGLTHPKTGERPFAVVQLRQDDLHASLYNMVGFQTRMKYPEQERVFRTLPGLEQARFARLGSMHRNTFLNSPRLLDQDLQLKNHRGIYFAGQITGVEGYVESAVVGLYVGLSLGEQVAGRRLPPPSPRTALGALLRHITQASPQGFQPMNVNFGLMEVPEEIKKKERRKEMIRIALQEMKCYREGMSSGNRLCERLAEDAPKGAHYGS
jgi:methylenetetrahydrofolate--tRNA-(uracil-5-)-methyltransferase